jgi:ABC-type transport system involved in cytochrome bd biosynthesis fused ATPase/permease subunit
MTLPIDGGDGGGGGSGGLDKRRSAVWRQAMEDAEAQLLDEAGRDLHSSTSQLNLSRF